MSEDIGQVRIAEPYRENCFFCDLPNEGRGTFHNGKAPVVWTYMPENKVAHIECYIHYCVERSFNIMLRQYKEDYDKQM